MVKEQSGAHSCNLFGWPRPCRALGLEYMKLQSSLIFFKVLFFLFFFSKDYLRLRVVVVSGDRAIYQLLIVWFKIFYINPIICTMMPSTNKTLSLLNWHETWGGVGVGGRFLISQLKNNTTMNEDDHQIVKLSLVDWENKSRGIK